MLYQNEDEELLKEKLICRNDSLKSTQSLKELIESKNCASLYLKSIPFAGRCVPEVIGKLGEFLFDEKSNKTLEDENGNKINASIIDDAGKGLAFILNAREVGEQIFEDISNVWWIMILFLIASMVLSFIWIILMRIMAGVMVWLSFLCVTGILGFGCYYSVTMYMKLVDQPEAETSFKFTTNVKSYLALKNTWLAFAIITGLLLIILLLLLIFLRKRILIAIALIKEGSRAVGTMVSSLFFPIIPYIFMFALFVFWGSVSLYIASAGQPSFRTVSNTSTEKCDPHTVTDQAMCIFTKFEGDPNLFRAQIYNLFGLFWGMFFIVGVGQVSLAGAFASYYWTFKKSDVPSFAVGKGFWRCTRYHLGSVAFGSLIIAIVRMIRVMLEYIDNKLKKYDNQVTKALLWCCKCCFWCLEKFLKFINKNAYIMIAVYGKNFCTSAREAFSLLMRNIVRVVVLDKVTDFLLFLGKVVVVGATTLASFYIFSGEADIPQLKIDISVNYYLMPVIVMEDSEKNDGSAEKPYFMSTELMKILNKKNKFQDRKSK
ncbi:choline transporter-like protein 2 [Limulus polyphemus]|uniref:Choline transporter-like protein n=1 Tax=Limulus polyphemus TaxID=6850 RepID=A0ABM1SUF4_LIMPO|nr:choline transporter-like protein 2 [Limulus polyphemus]